MATGSAAGPSTATTTTIAGTVQTKSVDPKLLGETYGFWCQTGFLALAAFVAWRAIRISRTVERKKAAAEVIFSSRQDVELTKAIRHITELHHADKNMATFAKPDNNTGDEANSIRYALNHYEYVAVGIARGIYDENIFKSSSFSTITTLYKRTKPYIEAVRVLKGSKTIWQDFECLACRWIDNPLEHKPIRSVQKRNIRRWLAQKIAGTE